LNCEAVVQALSDYIDGLLAEETHRQVEEHLAGCGSCHLVFDTTLCTILLYRASRSTALVGDRRAQLLRRLEAACGGCGSKKDGAEG
jgi:predicted anti-sigma-YlaC factor YlaD